MHGLGNDFVVVTGPVDLEPATVAAWCDRRLGIGADGVLELTAQGRNRVGMRYWNADGGEAEMCGNGLRCIAMYARDLGWVDGDDMVVATAVGDMPAQIVGDTMVRALVGTPTMPKEPMALGELVLHPVSVGNPHAVVFVADPDAVALEELGPRIEHDTRFPDRTNVEFVTPTGSNHVRMRIWERGVGETKASGTGATAAAYAAVQYRGLSAPVTVALPGGELVIEFEGPDAWMTGPAVKVFSGRI